MPARAVSIVVVCTGVSFAGAYLSQAQEATSANLPDQFQTGEMIQIQKPKKKTESNSQTVATAPKQDAPPVPEEIPTAEETPLQIAPVEEKKTESYGGTASTPRKRSKSRSKHASRSIERQDVAAGASPQKHRPVKRRAPVAPPEPPSISEAVPVSLSVAQSMAITAPLPDYTYEMKRRNLAGNGVCLVTVDQATGTVTNATMSQSTGSPLLDNATIQTFKSWRFKPGSVSQVRIPITYE